MEEVNRGDAGENGGDTVQGIPRWKRVLDLLCIGLTLPGWALLMGFIALAIKLLSPGPVLFQQQRVGYRGRRFNCLKFRSMKVGAETQRHEQYLSDLIESDRPMIKLDAHGDPRLIPGGAWLRSSGLDELPQLFNVLRGEMSLVGPRPCTPHEFEQYLPSQRERFSTLPGLTGLWQVSGKNKTTFSQMVHLDSTYARTKSLGLDLKIMSLTLFVLVDQVRDMLASRMEEKRQPAVPARPGELLATESRFSSPMPEWSGR